MLFKKKRSYVVTVRSYDEYPFEINLVTFDEEQQKKRVIPSPMFGNQELEQEEFRDHGLTREEIDEKYDPYREKPKLDDEHYIKKYGSVYYEFDPISSTSYDDYLNKRDKKPINDTDVSTFEVQTPKQVPSNEEEIRINDNPFSQPIVEQEPVIEEQEYVSEYDVVEESVTPVEDEYDEVEEEVKVIEEKPSNKPIHLTKDYSSKSYQLPPLSLLAEKELQEDVDLSYVEDNAEIIVKEFNAFKVDCEIVNITLGPTVTRYEVKVAEGVNVKNLSKYTNNLMMRLGAKTLRIETPIPGKKTVGIEIPSKVRQMVRLRECIEDENFLYADSPLSVVVGKDIDGVVETTSIYEMPHGLVAGSTGSGKSVFTHSILISLLYRYSPEQLKLILIDPKKVEYSPYKGIPHLLTPVMNDAKGAIGALKWAVEEMERRYDELEQYLVSNIYEYNEMMAEHKKAPMPYIVILIEEVANLMMQSNSGVEDVIMELTQKSRACGIHCIFATQRPSVDVIKGSIKNNITERFAFMVASSQDSGTILGTTGAEHLIGDGDMLFKGSGRKIKRVQGPYVSKSEVISIANYIKSQRSEEYYFTTESLIKDATKSSQIDDQLIAAAYYVVSIGKCSNNRIQQQFGVGFNTADSIIQRLEEFNIVGPNVGKKARDILMTKDELDELFK